MDTGYPFAAFSHEQVRAATSGGFLAVERDNFAGVAERLLSVNRTVFDDMATRMSKGELIRPESDEEKLCFRVIEDLDVLSGKIEGSSVSKKYMRNEIWSLVVAKGAPSWYITLSP
ncbi:hypothetical protein DXG01_013786, partial [Tephrocybe rancida]